MSLGLFKDFINNRFTNHILNICIKDLVLNNLQWLICHKTKPLALVWQLV